MYLSSHQPTSVHGCILGGGSREPQRVLPPGPLSRLCVCAHPGFAAQARPFPFVRCTLSCAGGHAHFGFGSGVRGHVCGAALLLARASPAPMSQASDVVTAAALGLCRGRGELVLATASTAHSSAGAGAGASAHVARPAPDLQAAHIRSVARERFVSAKAGASGW
jgi:hypothetical protein